MRKFPPPPWPVVEVGLAAAILGSVAAILILLPVLSIPLSTVGLLCGVIGTVIACRGYPTSLRIAVVGTALCGMVLSAGLLVYFAPRSETPGRAVQPLWQQPPGRPTVPPPASQRDATRIQKHPTFHGDENVGSLESRHTCGHPQPDPVGVNAYGDVMIERRQLQAKPVWRPGAEVAAKGPLLRQANTL